SVPAKQIGPDNGERALPGRHPVQSRPLVTTLEGERQREPRRQRWREHRFASEILLYASTSLGNLARPEWFQPRLAIGRDAASSAVLHPPNSRPAAATALRQISFAGLPDPLPRANRQRIAC